jgi:hypothetical protein
VDKDGLLIITALHQIRCNRNPIGSFPDSREYEIAGGNVDTKI